VKGLFDRESEAWNLMVQVRRADLETRLSPKVTRKRTRRQIASRECLGAREARTSYGVNIDFKHLDVQGVILDEIPGVAPQFPIHVVNDARRTIEVKGAVPAEDCPEEMIKTDKVVQVGMGHEDIAHAEEFARWQAGERTQIKKESAPCPANPNVQGRIPPRAVDQLHLKGGFHATT
jgi:hypothetical protein